MISKKLALEVLNRALQTGSDFAELFFENTVSNNLTMENGNIEESTSNVVYGVGLRILNKLQSAYAHTSDLSKKSLLSLADDLSKAFSGKRQVTATELRKERVKNLHPINRPLTSVTKEEKIAKMKEVNDVMAAFDKRIVRTNVYLMSSVKTVTIMNSKGRLVTDERQRGRIYLMAVASENGKIETAGEGPGAQAGFEFFTDDLNLKELARETARSAINVLNAVDAPSGKMPVVIGNGFGGVIFHEACGHPLEATAVSKKLSVFHDKMGKQIANPVVTAIDDGTIPNGWGSGNIDDEGNPTQKNVLIKDGILTGFLVDGFNGRRMNATENGASRRQNYKYEPTSRMSNTYIANGKSTVEEIIKATPFGLYAKKMGGGSVNPATGEFNFAVSEGYMIRDGKIAEAVKGASLVGRGDEILPRIDMVANDLARAQGMCGSVSGSIPVDVGQPTIRVTEITVGGRKGARQ